MGEVTAVPGLLPPIHTTETGTHVRKFGEKSWRILWRTEGREVSGPAPAKSINPDPPESTFLRRWEMVWLDSLGPPVVPESFSHQNCLLIFKIPAGISLISCMWPDLPSLPTLYLHTVSGGGEVWEHSCQSLQLSCSLSRCRSSCDTARLWGPTHCCGKGSGDTRWAIMGWKEREGEGKRREG